VTALKCGDEILLVDKRGCHTIHIVQSKDYRTGTYFKLGGGIWKAQLFELTPDVDVAGRPVNRSQTPAIGQGSKFHPLFLPAGWSSPAHLHQLLRQQEVKH
jgi:hypothetical protein